MTGTEALNNIAVYSAIHNNLLDESIKIIGKDLNKLSSYEDIEEELGIDLVTLFKALKENDFYSKHPETGEVSWIPLPELYYCNHKWNIGCQSIIFNEQEKCCDSWDCAPEDYGKTWAFTKEELENEK